MILMVLFRSRCAPLLVNYEISLCLSYILYMRINCSSGREVRCTITQQLSPKSCNKLKKTTDSNDLLYIIKIDRRTKLQIKQLKQTKLYSFETDCVAWMISVNDRRYLQNFTYYFQAYFIVLESTRRCELGSKLKLLITASWQSYFGARNGVRRADNYAKRIGIFSRI